MSLVTTITVNQWHIKHNAENPDDPKPVVCVNTYRNCAVFNGSQGVTRVWGPKVGLTVHYNDFDVVGENVRVVYDPINKTPCGASCWMQVEGGL